MNQLQRRLAACVALSTAVSAMAEVSGPPASPGPAPTFNTAPPPPPAAPAVPAASAARCARVAAEQQLGSKPYESWVLINTAGAVCYEPFPLRQRDTLRFGLVVAKGQAIPEAAAVSITSCSVPSASPVVLGSLEGITLDAGTKNAAAAAVADKDLLQVLPTTVSCGSESPVVATSVTMPLTTPATQSHSLTLFPRYAATLHLGLLSSKLHETEYDLLSTGDSTVITDKSPGRGPEYVAMLVVQAAPRYLRFGGPVYPGRDMLHDNEMADRLGLAFSFGLKDPSKRFGLGLSYEIASGLNVALVHEWMRRSVLNGVKVGDPFSGDAGAIPTRTEWSRGWAIGLTFDSSYLTGIFKK